MLIAKVSAVVAAVLFMSSVSAQAMEFADRPGITVTSSLPAIQVASVGDLARRQIHQPKSLLGTDEKTMAIVNSILARLAQPEGPGRLSAEFSAVVKPSGVTFEFGPGELASWLKPTATAVAMNFKDRRRPITSEVKTLTTISIKNADHHIFTSSLARAKPPFGLHIRPGAVKVAGEALHRGTD